MKNVSRGGYSHHPRDFAHAYKLSLPSFGLGIYRSAPTAHAVPKKTLPLNSLIGPWESGDAFSATYMYEGEDFLPAIDQSFLPLSRGYLRRVLLEILAREEHEDIENHHRQIVRAKRGEGIVTGQESAAPEALESPVPQGQVRLSDLRLANDIRPQELSQELDETLSSLIDTNRELTTEDVLRWKHKKLGEYKSASLKRPREWTEQERKTEHTRVIALSFAAAALCLFLDPGASNLRQATYKNLRTSIIELATVIRGLTERLDTAMADLGRLVATKRTGRPKTEW